MSYLLAETDDYLELEAYIHGNNDEFSRWELDTDGNQKYPDGLHEAEHFALVEFRVKYRINKKTFDVEYLSFE